jgi:hypothetical protein
MDIFEYVSWCIHIREYIGLTTTTEVGNILSTWESAGVTIGTYKILYIGFYIYSYCVYGCKYITNLHIMFIHVLYKEYSVYMYLDICSLGGLTTRCN